MNLQELSLAYNQITSIESGDFEGLPNLQSLHLWGNRITSIDDVDFEGLNKLQNLNLSNNGIKSIDAGDFEGLMNLQRLDLGWNGITSIESGAFAGLNQLRQLWLWDNELSELNFAGAIFEQLGSGPHLGFPWRPLTIGGDHEVTSLILDDATLSLGSFDTIVDRTDFIPNVSLVGLSFSDSNPTDLSGLLRAPRFGEDLLHNVTVDQALFDTYADEFNAFDAKDGKTVTVVPLGDCDKDGALNASDLSCVFTIRSRDAVLGALDTLPGDLDGDGEVAFLDFLKLAENFGKSYTTYAEGNFDLKDGVAFADFLELANNFGKKPTDVAAVPEPGAMILVLLSLLLSSAWRRKRS